MGIDKITAREKIMPVGLRRLSHDELTEVRIRREDLLAKWSDLPAGTALSLEFDPDI